MSRQHIRNDHIHREVFNLKYAKLKTNKNHLEIRYSKIALRTRTAIICVKVIPFSELVLIKMI